MLIYNSYYKIDTKGYHSFSPNRTATLSRPELSSENKTYLLALGFKLK